MKADSVKKSLWFATGALVIGVVLSMILRDSNGHPDSSWIQTGASLALILITYSYVRITEKTLEEARRSREDASKTLAEAERARLQSYIPQLILRSRKYHHEGGFDVYETFLTNAGPGTAVKIDCSTSALYLSDYDLESKKPEDQVEITTCLQGKYRKSEDAMGASFGSINNRISLFEQRSLGKCFTPATGNTNFMAIVVYEDILGRGYCSAFSCTSHMISKVYSSNSDSTKKQEIRSSLLKCISYNDLAKFIRDHDHEFWKAIVKKQK